MDGESISSNARDVPALLNYPNLRPAQAQALVVLQDHIRSGARELSISMAVGTGRTQVLLHLIYEQLASAQARSALYVTSSSALKNQMIDRMNDSEVQPGRSLIDIAAVSAVPPDDIDPVHKGVGRAQETPTVFALTIQALANWMKRSNRRGPDAAGSIAAFDLIIFDEDVTAAVQRGNGVWFETVNALSGVKIFFANEAMWPHYADQVVPQPVYVLTQDTALAQGILRYPVGERLRPGSLAVPPSGADSGRPVVYISGSSLDLDRAGHLENELRASSFVVRSNLEAYREVGSPSPKERIHQSVVSNIQPQDVLIILISGSLPTEMWSSSEVDALVRRGIEIVPIALESIPVPDFLANLGVADGRYGFSAIAEEILARRSVQFAKLSPEAFERLAIDLLHELGFEFSTNETDRADYVARFRNPVGFYEANDYVVQIKFSTTGISQPVRHSRKLVSDLRAAGPGAHGILVVNSQLTSAARSAVQEINRSGQIISVIDATGFKRLLLQHRSLVWSYFRSSDVAEGR